MLITIKKKLMSLQLFILDQSIIKFINNYIDLIHLIFYMKLHRGHYILMHLKLQMI
jgi:hypothetical protein